MSNVDKQIKELGYEVCKTNLSVGYIVYENKVDDIKVTIEWDSEEEYCLIFANTISKQKDWYGHLYSESVGLSIKEYLTFIEKIQEMRKIQNLNEESE